MGSTAALRFVPHEKAGFPDLDKSAHGLKQVHAAEHAGMVFVTQEGEPGADYFTDIPAIIGADQLVYSSNMRETPANWKIMLEGFLEGYHIRTTHPESFLPYGFDNLNVVETFGRHARVVFPFKRIEKLRDVRARAARRFRLRHAGVPHLPQRAGDPALEPHGDAGAGAHRRRKHTIRSPTCSPTEATAKTPSPPPRRTPLSSAKPAPKKTAPW